MKLLIISIKVVNLILILGEVYLIQVVKVCLWLVLGLFLYPDTLVSYINKKDCNNLMKFLAFLHYSDLKSNYSHMLGPYNLIEIDFQTNFLLCSVCTCISSPISSKIKAPTKVFWKFKIWIPGASRFIFCHVWNVSDWRYRGQILIRLDHTATNYNGVPSYMIERHQNHRPFSMEWSSL